MKFKQIKLDKATIQNYSLAVDENSAIDFCYNFEDILDDVFDEIMHDSNKAKIISFDVKFINDFAFHTNIYGSDVDVIITLKSPELEANTIGEYSKVSKRFFDKIVFYFKKFKANKKRRFFIFRKRKNKKQNSLEVPKSKVYTLLNLKDDLFEKLADYFSNTTVLYNFDNKISILSNEEHGVNVNIYLTFASDDNYRQWITRTTTFKNIYLFDAIGKIEKKNERINYSQNNLISKNSDLLLKAIRTFKNFVMLITQSKNYAYIDSLIYNCPDELFKDDIYQTTIRLINYLKTAPVADFYCIYDEDKTICDYYKITQNELVRIINCFAEIVSN